MSVLYVTCAYSYDIVQYIRLQDNQHQVSNYSTTKNTVVTTTLDNSDNVCCTHLSRYFFIITYILVGHEQMLIFQ